MRSYLTSVPSPTSGLVRIEDDADGAAAGRLLRARLGSGGVLQQLGAAEGDAGAVLGEVEPRGGGEAERGDDGGAGGAADGAAALKPTFLCMGRAQLWP